jgi:hypothetical protein
LRKEINDFTQTSVQHNDGGASTKGLSSQSDYAATIRRPEAEAAPSNGLTNGLALSNAPKAVTYRV